MTLPAAPTSDADVPRYWGELGLPGLADIHMHFLPERVMSKVWAFFDDAENYGIAWPITYRRPEAERLEIARALGVRAVPTLPYPHKPGMAEWLNGWAAEFAARVPDGIHCATLYPEPSATRYVTEALDAGARLFKVHVTVGEFTPLDPLLEGAWAELERRGTPVVIHAGSAPRPGTYTGDGPVAELMRRYPRLTLVIAHLGMGEYDAFADLAQAYERVHLDTTMVGTTFTDAFAPLPPGYLARLAELADRVVLGSDFPNIPYPYYEQIRALHDFDLGPDWMRAVLWHNGARLLHLAPDPSPPSPRR